MNVYIVTEGQFDAVLLSRLLAEEVQVGVAIVAASGKSGAQSLARSLVAARRRPVALVLDADTTDEAFVHRQRLVARELLAMASPGIRTEVFMAVPSIEVLFFTDRRLLSRLLGDDVPDAEWAAGRFQPKSALEEILRKTRTQVRNLTDLLGSLEDADVARMGEYPLVRDIREFIRQAALVRAVEV